MLNAGFIAGADGPVMRQEKNSISQQKSRLHTSIHIMPIMHGNGSTSDDYEHAIVATAADHQKDISSRRTISAFRPRLLYSAIVSLIYHLVM